MVESSSQSFIEYPADNHFPIQNIPFGAARFPGESNACATRIGDFVVNLGALEAAGLFKGTHFSKLSRKDIFSQRYLNDFIELGSDYWKEARAILQSLFSKDNQDLQGNADLRAKSIFPLDKVKLTMPMRIGDYTDFYSSKNHAYNVGVMFRGPDNALQPNWVHLPVGYHGRASSVVISGTPIRRPKGQVSADKINPSWSECKRLDIELEMGAVVGTGNQLGEPIKVKDANNHIFGYTLLNDWSARDLQVWEYVPLGPFNAKNFASTISPWIITKEALEPFKLKLPEQDPKPLPYLQDESMTSYDVELNVYLKTEKMEKGHLISTANMKYLYWSPAQQLAHHSVTGCNMNAGDLLGSGTISGPDKGSYGSMLEITWSGKEKIQLPNGEERIFLQNGDEVNLEGVCKGDGYLIGFGECHGKILPSLEDSSYF